mmetsp:Transcript_39876/g.79783  ORF Transcript_39876/g.79783 Transcript_39876/m.79783 type:complete len:115 (-) Transcript_39876:321-665(-)
MVTVRDGEWTVTTSGSAAAIATANYIVFDAMSSWFKNAIPRSPEHLTADLKRTSVTGPPVLLTALDEAPASNLVREASVAQALADVWSQYRTSPSVSSGGHPVNLRHYPARRFL